MSDEPNGSKTTGPDAPNCVTIFGGGISGLTVAHELVERGYRVQVWEPAQDARSPDRGCDVGGMARTQWSRVHWPEETDVTTIPPLPEFADRSAADIHSLPQRFFFKVDTRPPVDAEATGPTSRPTFENLTWVVAFGERGWSEQFAPVLDELRQAIGRFVELKPLSERQAKPRVAVTRQGRDIDPAIDVQSVVVYCEVFRRWVPSAGTTPEDVKLADQVRMALSDKAGIKIKFEEIKPPFYKELLRAMATLTYAPKELPRIPAAHWGTATAVEIVVRSPIVLLDGFPEGIPDDINLCLRFRVRERHIPGEHGFRFFPGFYKHLFDTMKRTPILEPVPKPELEAAQERSVTVNPNPERYVESGRCCYDNITPTSRQGLAFRGAPRLSVLSRSLPTSIEDLLEWARVLYGAAADEKTGKPGEGLNFTKRDVARFELKLFEYMTSCGDRRCAYEEMSWLEFLTDGVKPAEKVFTKDFLDAINAWPEALVSMDADGVDARSEGTALLQLVLDNLVPSGYRDGTLNGPTSVAWLTPWRRYLEAQGVEFIHGKLTSFRRLGPKGSGVFWPEVECYEPRYPGALGGRPELMPGYFVMALPIEVAQPIAKNYVAQGGNHPDLCALEKFPLYGDVPLTDAKPGGEFRHMFGIQYYFDEDVFWLDGHVYYVFSPWGLSSISQVRFWADKHDWEHGYRGVLSVVVSAAYGQVKDAQGNPIGSKAWDLAPAELAENVWTQVKQAVGARRIPEPRYWRLDANLKQLLEKSAEEATSDHAGYENKTPYLINSPGKYRLRPGKAFNPNPEEPERKKQKREAQDPNRLSGYCSTHNIVLAGVFMKTFTRMNTMEAANESGRHAANAILQASCASLAKDAVIARGSPCDIWPLEDREPADLRLLKELDQELYDRGLDHFVTLLELNRLVTHGLSGRPADPFDPHGALAPLQGFVKALSFGLDPFIATDSPSRQGDPTP